MNQPPWCSLIVLDMFLELFASCVDTAASLLPIFGRLRPLLVFVHVGVKALTAIRE